MFVGKTWRPVFGISPLVIFSKGNTEGTFKTKDPMRISSLNCLSCVNNNTRAHKTGMLPIFMVPLSPEITHQFSGHRRSDKKTSRHRKGVSLMRSPLSRVLRLPEHLPYLPPIPPLFSPLGPTRYTNTNWISRDSNALLGLRSTNTR